MKKIVVIYIYINISIYLSIYIYNYIYPVYSQRLSCTNVSINSFPKCWNWITGMINVRESLQETWISNVFPKFWGFQTWDQQIFTCSSAFLRVKRCQDHHFLHVFHVSFFPVQEKKKAQGAVWWKCPADHQATGRSARADGNGTSARVPPWCRTHVRPMEAANLGICHCGGLMWAAVSFKQTKGDAKWYKHRKGDLSINKISFDDLTP